MIMHTSTIFNDRSIRENLSCIIQDYYNYHSPRYDDYIFEKKIISVAEVRTLAGVLWCKCFILDRATGEVLFWVWVLVHPDMSITRSSTLHKGCGFM